MPLGSNLATPRGVDSLHRLTMGKKSKIFFSETTGPTALIFGMWQWLMVLYIDCASHAPALGLNLATPRGWIVSIDLQLEKLKKSSSLKPLGPQL